MSMKISCDKCGYILGGIEVKENYGCNACNPFYLAIPTLKDYSMVGGNTHSAVNSEPVVDSLLQGTTCGDCGHINGSHLDKCPRKDILNAPKVPSRPPLPLKYCVNCARILIQKSIGTYYDTDTGEMYNHWQFTCPQYRWWKVWDRYHAHWRCNEDGSTYSYEA